MIYPFVSIFFWSTVAVISKLLLKSYNNFQLLWISSLFAALLLLFVNGLNGSIRILKTYKIKDFVISILICLPGTFLYYVFYYAGTDILPASQAFVINYMWPIMSVIFACIILKEKMTVLKAVAIFMSFLGIVIAMSESFSSFDSAVLIGGVWCLLGAASYGVFTALNKKYHYQKSISLMLSYFATFLLTTLINAFDGKLFIPSAAETVGFAWNGMLTMALANIFWVTALDKGDTAKISNLAYITPFLSLIWTYLFLDEPLNQYFIIGLAVIVCGMLIQFKKTKKQ